jgi:hypothetical protein
MNKAACLRDKVYQLERENANLRKQLAQCVEQSQEAKRQQFETSHIMARVMTFHQFGLYLHAQDELFERFPKEIALIMLVYVDWVLLPPFWLLEGALECVELEQCALNCVRMSFQRGSACNLLYRLELHHDIQRFIQTISDPWFTPVPPRFLALRQQ